jgi:hypothetical protein
MTNLPTEIKAMILAKSQITLETCLISKAWLSVGLEILYQAYLDRHSDTRVGSMHSKAEIRLVKLICVAAFSKVEWGHGALRLFYFEDQLISPNPKNPEFNNLIKCTMNVKEYLNSRYQDMDSDTLFLVRFSESLHSGSYLVHIRGLGLYRVNPNGRRIVIWDARGYGSCNYCSKKLKLTRVCASCKLEMYCTKECQVKDWAAHKISCETTLSHL